MSLFYNAHHAPMGAFSTFTLGYPGASGGFGLELEKPAGQNIYIGAEKLEQAGSFEALPFFGKSDDKQSDFVMDEQGDKPAWAELDSIPESAIQREMSPTVDTWRAGSLSFTIYSPTWKLGDPDKTGHDQLQREWIPAVFAELTVDNRRGRHPRRVFFGYTPDNKSEHMRELWHMHEKKGITGLASGNAYGVATDVHDAQTSMQFSIESILGEPDRYCLHFGNGTLGIVDAVVDTGKVLTIPLVLAFHRPGIVTSGRNMSYAYNRYFSNLESVFEYGLKHFDTYKQAAIEQEKEWRKHSLSEDQEFQLFQAIRSYYGSTQLLEENGTPLWIVNEGEYRMMNTLDLTMDQVFFEMRRHPWTTRNVLDHFRQVYCYTDEVFVPGNFLHKFPGGISFCHDMGVMNCFTQPGYSCYERPYLVGCFSYMTFEELVNWTVCALIYLANTGDNEWAKLRQSSIHECFLSLLNRDDPNPLMRNGVMSLDSDRTVEGAEITTYDSLDTSLGQARGNSYLAVKSWACYQALECFFTKTGDPETAEECRLQARRVVETLMEARKEDGTFPAVIEGEHPSVIIPILEGLVILDECGLSDCLKTPEFEPFYNALREHFEKVLVPGICLFEDGGWKLSSSSDNSWLSKIYLCQYVVRKVLGIDSDLITRNADRAHAQWLKHPDNSWWAWSDQMHAGKARGSRYYPRGVTSILWLDEAE